MVEGLYESTYHKMCIMCLSSARWRCSTMAAFVGMNELLKGTGSANQKPMPIKLHKDITIAAT